MLLLNRANELLEQGKLREAEFMFKTVLKENNKLGPALFGLGRICMRLEDFDSAIYYLRRACEFLPKMLEPLLALSDAYRAIGSSVDAKTVLEYTLSVAKHNAEVHYQLGEFYLEHGFVDNAKRTFEAGLSCPHSTVTVFMLHELVQLCAVQELDNYIVELNNLLEQYEHKRLIIITYFALGKCYERLEKYKSSFEYYYKANELQLGLCKSKTSALLPFINRLKDYYSDDFFEKPNDKLKATFTPAFIVGLPRTGQTLLENILVQHSEVESIGENEVIKDKIIPYLESKSELPYPECLVNLSTATLDHCRNLFVDEIKKHRISEQLVINKLPENIYFIGLIQKIFPDARIIHVTRAFHANAWSVFSNHFANSEPYLCSLSEYKLFAEYENVLMTHYKEHLPRNIYTLNYEKLLEDTPRVLNTLLNFLYLKFEPECLDFYKSHRPTSTIGKSQIKQPLNQRSRSKWQPFEKFIKLILDDTQTNPVDL